jgi:hypothetical protein|tara:strand:+ start:12814 stop:13221 length:408 start_codon:yes stop_codon:yes gene_type:complete
MIQLDSIDTESQLNTTTIDFLPFDNTLKIYVFKKEHAVQLSFKLSEQAVFTDRVSIKDMEIICQEWNNGGVNGIETWMGKVYWEERKVGPRPDCKPASFVAIQFNKWNFRLTIKEMEDVINEFNKQLKGDNHWDE